MNRYNLGQNAVPSDGGGHVVHPMAARPLPGTLADCYHGAAVSGPGPSSRIKETEMSFDGASSQRSAVRLRQTAEPPLELDAVIGAWGARIGTEILQPHLRIALCRFEAGDVTPKVAVLVLVDDPVLDADHADVLIEWPAVDMLSRSCSRRHAGDRTTDIGRRPLRAGPTSLGHLPRGASGPAQAILLPRRPRSPSHPL